MATYKRGNDEVDLDQYIRDAEAGFDFWLSHPAIKKEQKQELRDIYRKMIQGISDGSVTYKLGGGYDNTIGITNKDDKFDAAGLVAGYLGDVLRRQAVYKAPDPEPDTSKIEYKGATTIGELALPELLGEGLNPQYFINLDTPGADGKRGHTKRLEAIKTFLKGIHDNWDTRFRGFSQEQKDRWFQDYDLYGNIDVDNNGFIDENEYLGLSKLMGINNVEQLLYTGKPYGETAKNNAEVPKTYANETEYLNAEHPRNPKSGNFVISLISDKQNYTKSDRQDMVKFLADLPDDKLLSTIQKALKIPLNTRVGKFTNNYILATSLEIARRKGLLDPFSENDNRYYVPLNSEYFNSNSIGLVYEISQNRNHKLRFMDRRDIPHFTKKWHDEFVTYTPIHKEGGILKFQNSGKFQGSNKYLDFSKPFDQDVDIYEAEMLDTPDIQNDKGFFQGFPNSNHSLGKAAGLNTWDKTHYDENNKAKTRFGNAEAINSLNEYKKNGKFLADILEVFKNGIDGETLQDKLNNYNSKVSQIRKWQSEKQYMPYSNQEDDNIGIMNELFNTLYKSYLPYSTKGNIHKKLGSHTFARLALAFNSIKDSEQFRNFKIDGFDDNIWIDNAGYLHIKNDTPATNTSSVTTTGTEQPKTPTEQALAARKSVVASTTKPTVKNKNQLFGKTTPVEEDQLPDLPEEDIKTNKWLDILPNLASIGRLPLSLYTNRNVYKTINPSLKPIIPETYERYSPIKGRFDKLQLGESQKASLLSRAYKPFVTDASLASNIMLDAHRQAMQYENQGFLEDNQEIARTANEALVRQEDNAGRRTDNFNKAITSINQTNREKAQLKASYYKNNWQSIDNFLAEQQKALTSRFEKNKLFSDQFREQIATDQAQRWYDSVMKAAERAKNTWIHDNTKDGVTPDITINWNRYEEYEAMRKEAERMRNDMLRNAAAKIYGLSYTPRYTDVQYKNFRKWI